MLKIKDDVNLKELEKYISNQDSGRFFQYNSLSNPTKVLNISKLSREIYFTNGEFAAGNKIIKNLKQEGLLEEVN